MQSAWVALILSFLKGPIHYLVGKQVTEVSLEPTAGIRQGDTLSPALFSLVTSLLVAHVHRDLPGATPYLYADDTLIYLKGGKSAVQRSVRQLVRVLSEYAQFSGLHINKDKCGLLWKQEYPLEELPREVEGMNVMKNIRYLGALLGDATTEERYATAMTKDATELT